MFRHSYLYYTILPPAKERRKKEARDSPTTVLVPLSSTALFCVQSFYLRCVGPFFATPPHTLPTYSSGLPLDCVWIYYTFVAFATFFTLFVDTLVPYSLRSTHAAVYTTHPLFVCNVASTVCYAFCAFTMLPSTPRSTRCAVICTVATRFNDLRSPGLRTRMDKRLRVFPRVGQTSFPRTRMVFAGLLAFVY